MTHTLTELNAYTGALLCMALVGLYICVRLLGDIHTILRRFHLDYRKVNDLDARERMDDKM